MGSVSVMINFLGNITYFKYFCKCIQTHSTVSLADLHAIIGWVIGFGRGLHSAVQVYMITHESNTFILFNVI